jgi:predicted translin family RNA/ssDNA-binding protein
MREAVESADAQREAVIKRTRDVQKLSKQAIYSLHRWVCGDVAFVRADVPAAVVAAPCAVTALPGTTVRD